MRTVAVIPARFHSSRLEGKPLMDICGKGASFMGTAIVSAVSQVSGNISTGVGMIAILFVVGLVLFRVAVKATPGAKEGNPHS